VFVHPDAATAEEERAAIGLVVEVTAPTSRDAVYNDRTVKPAQHAKGGVPLYLLVDQERATWTLHGLAEGWQRYQIVAEGAYGEDIPLPRAGRVRDLDRELATLAPLSLTYPASHRSSEMNPGIHVARGS
jgi:hypothetical protein